MRWRCPVCEGPIVLGEGDAACANNHRFDRAKQGYFNLLLANQKRSKQPGDSREMITARREFLQAGHYQPLAECLTRIASRCADDRSSFKLLDVGCGEGYYSASVARALTLVSPFAEVAGVDISRDALKLASRQYPEQRFVVASGFNLPLQDNELDMVMRVFAPGDAEEMQRVLKPEGYLLIAYPGPRHLYELKQTLYDSVKLHDEPETPPGFSLVDEEVLSFTVSLTSREQVQALLQMTPLFWRGKREVKASLEQLEQFDVTADFIVRCYSHDHE